MTEKAQQLLNDSKAVRWTALSLISFTMLAAYYFVDAIAPLQTLVQQKYAWTSDNWGFFSGSEYLLNVMGFLIISGIILDKMGIRFTGLLSSSIMLVGGGIKLYALSSLFPAGPLYGFFNSFWPTMPATAKLAALGYAIFGIGVEMCGITVSLSLVKWFKCKELALAMGSQLATARLGASIAFFFSSAVGGVKTVGGVVQGSPVNPVALGVALLAIGLLTFLVYSVMDRKFDKQIGRYSDADPSEAFHLSDLGKIITNPGFLVISLLCVLFYSGVFPFLKYAVAMMQARLGLSPGAGEWIPGLLPVGTILLTPVFGLYLDNRGKGATLMILGSALLTGAHLTFALAPINMAVAIIAIMVLGVAFSLIPAAMWPSVPKIVEDRYLGSAYAMVFQIQNVGLWFIPWLIGVVIEKSNPGVSERIAAGDATAVYNYTSAMLIFAALGAAAIVLAFALKRIDATRRYGLELPNKKS